MENNLYQYFEYEILSMLNEELGNEEKYEKYVELSVECWNGLTKEEQAIVNNRGDTDTFTKALSQTLKILENLKKDKSNG